MCERVIESLCLFCHSAREVENADFKHFQLIMDYANWHQHTAHAKAQFMPIGVNIHTSGCFLGFNFRDLE